jgi:hypothetical protein
MVLAGLSTDWRFANCPAKRSPVLRKATTEGGKRLPSALEISVGCPPSITAIIKFVVPKSFPTVFAISNISLDNLYLSLNNTLNFFPNFLLGVKLLNPPGLFAAGISGGEPFAECRQGKRI